MMEDRMTPSTWREGSARRLANKPTGYNTSTEETSPQCESLPVTISNFKITSEGFVKAQAEAKLAEERQRKHSPPGEPA